MSLHKEQLRSIRPCLVRQSSGRPMGTLNSTSISIYQRLASSILCIANGLQPNHEVFEQTLMDISTPSHSRYGQHLKRDELKALIKPRAESTDAVLNWLKESGVASDDIENDGEWINFVAPVSTAEKMMDTTFKTYQSLVRDDVKKIRALRYSVPKEVRKHIDMIQPTTRFGQIRAQF